MFETQIIEGRKPIGVLRNEIIEEFRYIRDPIEKDFTISRELFTRLHDDQLTMEVVTNFLKNGAAYYKKRSESDDLGSDIDKKVYEGFQKAYVGTQIDGNVSDTIDFLKDEAESIAHFNAEATEANTDRPANFFGAFAPEQGQKGRKAKVDHTVQNYLTAARLFETNQKLNWVVKTDYQV